MNPADEARRRLKLSEEQKVRLAAGEHEQLAQELADRDPELSGWIFEQVWDFARAASGYRAAGRVVDTLRMVCESSDADLLESTLKWIVELGGEHATEGAAYLESRRLHAASARLLAAAQADESAQAHALNRSGDPRGAARVLLEADRPREALDQLGELEENEASGPAWNLAARCWWRLGDAHASARAVQSAFRCGVGATPDDEQEGTLWTLLAAALEALGHSDAAEVILGADDLGAASDEDSPQDGRSASERSSKFLAGGHGRYRVRSVHPTLLAGSAYLAIDRVTHQEVELHLLLADQVEQSNPDPASLKAVAVFLDRAQRAATSSHPALRRLLRTDPRAGLLVLPRADGPSLRSMIRPPGVLEHPARARSMIRFLLEGLASVHRMSMAHGGVLPHLISTDALGRPVLGPAGSDALSGLAATRTGGLEELLSLSAPEMHKGGDATPASDIYSAGRIWAALLLGRLKFELDELPRAAGEIIEEMTSEDPKCRPTAAQLVDRLASRVADFRVLGHSIRPEESGVLMQPTEDLAQAVCIEVARRWTDDELAQLCEFATPWMQTIVQREGRQLWLAPWPTGCGTLDPTELPLSKLHKQALDGLSPELQTKIRKRLRPAMIVKTPANAWFIALDGLLADGSAPIS